MTFCQSLTHTLQTFPSTESVVDFWHMVFGMALQATACRSCETNTCLVYRISMITGRKLRALLNICGSTGIFEEFIASVKHGKNNPTGLWFTQSTKYQISSLVMVFTSFSRVH